MIFMNLVNNIKRGVLFVIVTVIWTWSVLAVPIICGFEFENTVTKAAYILAGASPSVIGLIFSFISKDRLYISSLIKRIITIGNASAKHVLIVLFMVPTMTLISAYTSFLFTSVYPDFSAIRTYGFIGLIIFAGFSFIFGPLAEEIGWRGYLLDCWKDKGIVVYGAGIGLIWTIWHLPMFFIDGTYQNSLFLQGSIPVLCVALSTTALGVIIGYITKITNSVLLATLFHFTINFTGELIPLSLTGKIINTIILIVFASGIIYRDLERRWTCNKTNSR